MKPIAWMSPDGKVSQTEGKLFHIPLYTAPKPLSYNNIMETWWKLMPNAKTCEGVFEFARAIEERHGIK